MDAINVEHKLSGENSSLFFVLLWREHFSMLFQWTLLCYYNCMKSLIEAIINWSRFRSLFVAFSMNLKHNQKETFLSGKIM